MADTSRARPRAHRNDVEAARERRRERLARSVELLRSSESFRGWLRAMKRLHRYSPQNVRLIVSQCPQATFVASYRRWQRELGYQVRKGERGIMVFAPRLVRRDRAEPAEAPGESQEQRLVFRAVHVFDRSQVEPIPGRALPLEAPECAPVEGDTHASLIPRLEALGTELGFTVERRALEEGVGGRCDSKANLITVAADQSPNAEVRYSPTSWPTPWASATAPTDVSARSASSSARPTWPWPPRASTSRPPPCPTSPAERGRTPRCSSATPLRSTGSRGASSRRSVGRARWWQRPRRA